MNPHKSELALLKPAERQQTDFSHCSHDESKCDKEHCKKHNKELYFFENLQQKKLSSQLSRHSKN